MKTLLYVDCCIRREASRTRKLAEAFLSSLPEGWRVEKVTLMDEPLLPLMEGATRSSSASSRRNNASNNSQETNKL